MAGASVTLTLDDSDAQREISKLLRRLADPKPALREIGEVLTASTKDRFGSETDPEGRPWAPNSPVTLARHLGRTKGNYTKAGGLSARGRKRLAGKRILTQHGYLGDTIHPQLEGGGKGVAVGSAQIYAAMQQFGGSKSQFPNLWGDIPPRPFLGLSTADEKAVLGILRRHLGDTA